MRDSPHSSWKGEQRDKEKRRRRWDKEGGGAGGRGGREEKEEQEQEKHEGCHRLCLPQPQEHRPLLILQVSGGESLPQISRGGPPYPGSPPPGCWKSPSSRIAPLLSPHSRAPGVPLHHSPGGPQDRCCPPTLGPGNHHVEPSKYPPKVHLQLTFEVLQDPNISAPE